ncbi:MAG: PHP domain-containing protein [Verrucomicrobiota bacterium]|nr:PHP domain-containing protein [Verrucomicrobiota bacterium]
MTKQENICDLHLHSTCSDGTDSPSEVVRRAAEKGFRAISLTDHDTVQGLKVFHQAGKEYGVETINGVEITSEINGREIHILGYFVDMDDPVLLSSLKDQENHRLTRVSRMLVKLQALGLQISEEDMKVYSDKGTVGRPHLAMALVQKGYAHSIDDAFGRYLIRSGSAFVEKPRISAKEAIRVIRASSGVAILAHPGITHVDTSIRNLVAQGLQGIEVWHIRHDEKQNMRYLKICHELNLAATGGSDCHGHLKGPELMGKVRVPYERVEQLKSLKAA